LVLARPDLEQPAVLALLRSARPDVVLSWFWPKRIPEAVLALAPLGAFGVHPSLLPRWRGPDPYFWAIDAGDAYTGVTLHRLDAAYDTGDIVAQMRVAIGPTDNAWTLAKRLDKPSLALLVEAATQLLAGAPLAGVPQDEASATAAPQPDDDALALDFRQPAANLVRRIRALAPWPGAYASLGEHEVEIVAARTYAPALPRALEPGDAVLSPQGVVICAGAGGVLLQRVRDAQGRYLRGAEVAQLFPQGLFRLPATPSP
jgi:methionyl-tRNA formyltransferase